jgi:prepilin-type N-terminal cleavage/methylation domain-containing protein
LRGSLGGVALCFSVMRPVTPGSERGFTLVELLTVVAITGVLATIGTILVRKHFAHAKTAEAVATIQAIRMAEEARRAETGTYQNCSPASGTPWYPATPDGTLHSWNMATHGDWPSWRQLHVSQPDGPRFGFLVRAGTPGSTLPTPVTATKPTWPSPVQDPWYVIQAAGDQDKDTKYTLLLATSFNGELYVENDGE